MPKVYTTKKSRKEFTCTGCGQTIPVGSMYYDWTFRDGTTKRQGATCCGYPRRSQLTQSKMSQVYAAIESFETFIGEADMETVELSDIESAAESLTDDIRAVAEEYQEAAEAMGAAGAASEEKAEALEEAASEIESILQSYSPQDDVDAISDSDSDEYISEEEHRAARRAELVQEWVDQIIEAAGNIE